MIKLQKIRESKGLTKAELGRRAIMQGGDISKIERGLLVAADSQLEKLAAALGVDDPKTLVEEVE